MQPRTKTHGSVEKALRTLMFSAATVPLTDGYKMRLRHIGHAMNIIFGPLTTFSTHNFADTYSPLLRVLCEGRGGMPTEEEPAMPTLQEMHRMTAASPASTASFWLLRQELAYRHFYGMDRMNIGNHFLRSCDDTFLREDHLASSGTAGLSGFGESSLCPGEAQARGFEHGHDKKRPSPKVTICSMKTSEVCASRQKKFQRLLIQTHHLMKTARPYHTIRNGHQGQTPPATRYRSRAQRRRC